MQKVIGVYQVVQVVVVTEVIYEDGTTSNEEVVVNTVRRPIPVPYEQ